MTPLLAVVLLATVGGAQMFRASMTTEAAAAEGARYAATHSSSSEEDVAAWTRGFIDSEGLAVDVSSEEEAGAQAYTMRVTDKDGSLRTSQAKSSRTAVKVTASQTVHVLGLADVTMTASHTGFRSVEGLAI